MTDVTSFVYKKSILNIKHCSRTILQKHTNIFVHFDKRILRKRLSEHLNFLDLNDIKRDSNTRFLLNKRFEKWLLEDLNVLR